MRTERGAECKNLFKHGLTRERLFDDIRVIHLDLNPVPEPHLAKRSQCWYLKRLDPFIIVGGSIVIVVVVGVGLIGGEDEHTDNRDFQRGYIFDNDVQERSQCFLAVAFTRADTNNKIGCHDDGMM